MRTILITSLLALALLAAPVVLADRGDDGRTTADTAKARHAANETADDDDNETASHEAKASSRANRTEARAVAWENFTASVATLRSSWHENKTAIADSCHAATFDKENGTKEDRRAHSHCIRDGHREWRALHREELRELHAQLKALLSSWHKGRGHNDG